MIFSHEVRADASSSEPCVSLVVLFEQPLFVVLVIGSSYILCHGTLQCARGWSYCGLVALHTTAAGDTPKTHLRFVANGMDSSTFDVADHQVHKQDLTAIFLVLVVGNALNYSLVAGPVVKF